MADTPITVSPTRVTPLSEQEAAQTGYNTKFRVVYSDLTASTSGASDTVTLTLGATPTSWYINSCLMPITTAFTGLTAMTVTAGTTTSTAALISSTSVLTAATLNQAVGVPVLTNTTATAAKNLVIIFTAAGTGGPAALTAGQLDFYINLKNVALLP